ncbi:unnamed protein product [Withania somnifera]
MANEDNNPTTPLATKPNSNPSKDHSPVLSESCSSLPRSNCNDNGNGSNNNCKISDINGTDNSPLQRNLQSPEDFILSVASKIASQPLQCSDPDVWGVLTAISDKARKRLQGINMLLTSEEHDIGRMADNARFQILSPAVSAHHCKIYRKKVVSEDVEHPTNYCTAVFLKDSSTNGTYLNWEKLNKSSPEARLRHGDIISIAFAPQHELAYAFVFREVLISASSADAAVLKRKAEEFGSESKRLKGIGIGTSEGPISLDDFRSMQRSNTELRKQLESHVATIDSLRTENRAAVDHHEMEMKELRDSVSKSYIEQLKEIQLLLEAKEKELVDSSRISADQKHALEDLNERLNASEQSCVEANEIISSQKASISELKALLDEEREQRKDEREKAALDLKTSTQRVQAEAQEEIRRLSESAIKREKELQEIINKLQEAEKERCSLVETLRSKLEDTRQKLVVSDNKVRQLEAQIREEQLSSACRKKRIEELEHERNMLRKELESEKAAREEAWAKVSALELEISAAMRDLDFERRRLKGARERIMLRETQLRAFYSTTEEISVLFAKQQEQLKAMQRTLEDEENYENTSVDIDLNPYNRNVKGSLSREKEVGDGSHNVTRAGCSTSNQRRVRELFELSSDDASATEKHDCNNRGEEGGQDTQEVEFAGAECVKGGFGSEVDGVGTAPLEGDAVGTELVPESDTAGVTANMEGDLVGTEHVQETESLGVNSERNIDLSKFCGLAGNTMQLDDEAPGKEAQVQNPAICHESVPPSPANNVTEGDNVIEDTEAEGTIRTADLLASEVAGSWACSTAPSVHGENDTPKSKDNDACPAALQDSGAQLGESQCATSTSKASSRWDHDRKALSEMIGIVAPDLKDQFSNAVGRDCDQGGDEEDASDSATESCSDDKDNVMNTEAVSDAETVDGERVNEDVMDEDDEATQEDSVG